MNGLGGAMKFILSLLASATVWSAVAAAADLPPQWAYPANNSDYKPPADDGHLLRVPNSAAGYTWSQLRDRFSAPVWHPEDHPPLPEVVAIGRKPDVLACGFCHRADGPGPKRECDQVQTQNGAEQREQLHGRRHVRSVPELCPAGQLRVNGLTFALSNSVFPRASRWSRTCLSRPP